jgi:3,4-dihydroxy 2-butanone 4-phosphate synthase/GTP cyclohydrolase II
VIRRVGAPSRAAAALAAGEPVLLVGDDGVGSLISAADRAHTARLLADPDSGPDHFTRPGHVIPLLARSECWGSTGASVSLAAEAGRRPAAVSCAVVSARQPEEMAGPAELSAFAVAHDFELTTVAEVGHHFLRDRATRSA